MTYHESPMYQDIQRICAHPESVVDTQTTSRRLYPLVGLAIPENTPFTRLRTLDMSPMPGVESSTVIVDCGNEADIAHQLGFPAIVGRVGIALSRRSHPSGDRKHPQSATFSIDLDDIGNLELAANLSGPFDSVMVNGIKDVVHEWGITYSYGGTSSTVNFHPQFSSVVAAKLASIV